jgi:hypothetical protein
MWLLFLGIRLIRKNQPVLGATSLVLLAAAVWGQRVVGPGTRPSLDPHYVATSAVLVWAFALAVVLLQRGWSLHPEREGPAREI